MTLELVEIARARATDVAALAALHREVFPDYPTSKLGNRFCRDLFRRFIAMKTVKVLVARHADKVVGYCVGGERSALASVRRDLIPHAMLGALLNPRSFGAVEAVRHAARKLARRLRPGKPASRQSSEAATPRIVSLHLIGVAAKARGLGVGRTLLAAFDGEFAARYDQAVLSVAVDNVPARTLYETNGWELDLRAASVAGVSCSYRRRFQVT